MASETGVRLEREGAIGHLLLDRLDKKNALTQSMWDRLAALIDEAAANSHLKVLILRAAGPGAFSAGADIAEFGAHARDVEWRKVNQAAIRRVQNDLRSFPKATIAAIDGACVGGGCGLAIACDMRIATRSARFGITPAKLGLVYSLHDTKLLTDLVGPAHAREILFSGQLVDAARALEIGLLNHLVDDYDALLIEATTLAGTIAANSQHSVRMIKAVIARILEGASADDDETMRLFFDAFDGADHAEGVSAFLEKRKADFPS